MAMNVSGAGGGVRSDINITPLVDVVLVLLIIFMVAVPLLQMGYPVQVPPKVETAAPPPQSDDQVIVRLDGQGNMFINKTMYPEKEFGAKLREAMTGRASKVVFFAADGELPYEKVAHFMDLCRNNGADNLGIVFDDLRAGGGASPAGAP
ncbi:MAG: biopolymer transporter ExbD [Acidobacteria bacterium]|nr:biopolymer transporter ExbD [Acidobacteriota bacterium]